MPDQIFIEDVIKSIVENPNDVHVTRTVDEMGVLLTLSVHKDDMERVIGRQGAIAKALRTVLPAALGGDPIESQQSGGRHMQPLRLAADTKPCLVHVLAIPFGTGQTATRAPAAGAPTGTKSANLSDLRMIACEGAVD
jgi:predicted RNA-binding protein YlqC (UPF0109 family)